MTKKKKVIEDTKTNLQKKMARKKGKPHKKMKKKTPQKYKKKYHQLSVA